MNEDWTTEEAVDVIAFFQQVELAYEKGADREELLKASLSVSSASWRPSVARRFLATSKEARSK